MTAEEGSAPKVEIIDRAAQFAAGPPRISRKVIWITLGIAAVLGIGGAFADNSFNIPPAPTATVHHSAHEQTSLAQYLGLSVLRPLAAPPLALANTAGEQTSLTKFLGRPVLLGFLPANCGESCPVVAQELALASRLLSKRGIDAAVVVVNADPQLLSGPAVAGSLQNNPIATIPGVVFLSGSLAEMQQAWKSYGISIEVDPQANVLAYTSVIDLIDKSGHLRYSVTPFANESEDGTATLPAAELSRYAAGIASYVEKIG